MASAFGQGTQEALGPKFYLPPQILDESGNAAVEKTMNMSLLRLIQPLPINKPLKISKSDLLEISSEARKHGLLMLLYVQLRKYQDEFSGNGNILDYLKETKPLFLKNGIQSACQEAVEKEVLGLLREKNIPAIAFKGNTIAREIYREPNCRTSVDIDFLIKKSDVLRVDEIMSRAGYSRTDNNPVEFWLSRLHHAVYTHPKYHNIIEMHWNFTIPSLFNLTSEEIWDDVYYSNAGEIRLSPEIVLISLLLHHWIHAFRELRNLLDIVWAFHRYEREIDLYHLSRRLRKIGLIKTTRITLNQMENIFRESSGEIKAFQTLKHELKNGHRASQLLLSFFKIDIEKTDLSRHNRDNLIIRLSLDRWPLIIFSFFKTLFPFPDAIKELYKDRRNWFLPLNYLKFLAWRMKSWMG